MDESGYQKMIQNYRQVASFFQDKNILRINPIDSIWKSKNTILKLDCDDGRLYLFKRISEDSEISEIAKAAKLAQEYPVLFPQIFIVDRNAYLMEFIEGRTFFTLAREEMVPFSSQCGKILQETWSGDINGIKGLERKEPERKDLRGIIRDSFGQRRKKAARFFSQDELADYDFSPFASVPERQSHNDLNAANLFYVSGAAAGIRMIDPQELGFNDIARDIGRYCASTFFNNYDRFGNDKKHSLDIAEAFLDNFPEQDLERAKYYLGESFLSFLNYETISVSKAVLKNLALKVLNQKGPLITLLADSL